MIILGLHAHCKVAGRQIYSIRLDVFSSSTIAIGVIFFPSKIHGEREREDKNRFSYHFDVIRRGRARSRGRGGVSSQRALNHAAARRGSLSNQLHLLRLPRQTIENASAEEAFVLPFTFFPAPSPPAKIYAFMKRSGSFLEGGRFFPFFSSTLVLLYTNR